MPRNRNVLQPQRRPVPKSRRPQTCCCPLARTSTTCPRRPSSPTPSSPTRRSRPARTWARSWPPRRPRSGSPTASPTTCACIEGETGKCVYTTFEVPGWPDERRFLRLISATVAAKNFEQIKEDALERPRPCRSPRSTSRPPGGARLDARRATAPTARRSTPRSRSGRSSRAPSWPSRASRRPRPRSAPSRGPPGGQPEAKRKQYICHEEFVKQPPGTTYKINEVGGLLHVLFYRTAATVVDIGGGGGGVGEEEEEAEEP